jgi:hypothetical protein
MSLIPWVWTRFIIVVGSAPAIPPSVILSQLSWCHDRPINLVIVSRNPGQHLVDSQQERVQVLSVMKILINPHIHRFREIYFTITFSSSLPPFPDRFHSTVSILCYLMLDCMEDDGASINTWQSITSMEQQFLTLQWLAIDGQNYYNACRKGSQWTVKCQGVLHLEVSLYTPLPSQSFPTSEFLLPITCMPMLSSLNMTNLILHPQPFPTLADTWVDLFHVQLNNIQPFESMAAIMKLLGGSNHIALTHGPTGDPGPFNDDEELILRGIGDNQDLVPILHTWRGTTLNVIDCPSFNDAVLDVMSAYEEEDEIRTYGCADYASSLYIRDCSNFSAATLRHFVTNRSSDFAVLNVSSCAPDIADEDLKWFSEILDEFSYDPS